MPLFIIYKVSTILSWKKLDQKTEELFFQIEMSVKIENNTLHSRVILEKQWAESAHN